MISQPSVIAHFLQKKIVIDVLDILLQFHPCIPIVDAIAEEIGKSHHHLRSLFAVNQDFVSQRFQHIKHKMGIKLFLQML